MPDFVESLTYITKYEFYFFALIHIRYDNMVNFEQLDTVENQIDILLKFYFHIDNCIT